MSLRSALDAPWAFASLTFALLQISVTIVQSLRFALVAVPTQVEHVQTANEDRSKARTNETRHIPQGLVVSVDRAIALAVWLLLMFLTERAENADEHRANIVNCAMEEF